MSVAAQRAFALSLIEVDCEAIKSLASRAERRRVCWRRLCATPMLSGHHDRQLPGHVRGYQRRHVRLHVRCGLHADRLPCLRQRPEFQGRGMHPCCLHGGLYDSEFGHGLQRRHWRHVHIHVPRGVSRVRRAHMPRGRRLLGRELSRPSVFVQLLYRQRGGWAGMRRWNDVLR